MQLDVSGVSYSYPASINPIFENVTFTLSRGWTAMIGDNGCGKSTLAKIICGQIKPDTGFVSTDLLCILCEQSTNNPPDNLFEFAIDYSAGPSALRAALDINDDMCWRWDTLSFGERKRLQIACALTQEPDVLVVDEPTNHLDSQARTIVCDALMHYQGIGILISHDRSLINALAADCISFEPGDSGSRVLFRPGSYNSMRQQIDLERTTFIAQKRNLQRELTKLQQERDKRKQLADKASARKSKHAISPKDHDAKAKIDLAIVSGQDGKCAKLTKQLDQRIERAQRAHDCIRMPKRYDGALLLPGPNHLRAVVFRAAAGTISCGGHTLSLPELILGGTDHIGLTGLNGTGKSTLVKHIAQRIDPRINMLLIPQELSQTQQREVVDRIRKRDSIQRGKILSITAQLNSDPRRILEGAESSPGELKKLMLAEGLLQSVELIIMDEPTNHLDIHSIEALEQALRTYRGALLLVSHDDAFLRTCTTIKWHIEDGRLTVL